MGKRVVILGGGTGGTLIANRLRRMLDRSSAEIVVIDPDDEHVYQPGLLFVPFGKAAPSSLTRPRHTTWPPAARSSSPEDLHAVAAVPAKGAVK